MNRHERRKQKKERGNVSALQNELLKAIQFHVNKDFKNAELLYQQIISKEPDNYDALRHLGIYKNLIFAQLVYRFDLLYLKLFDIDL